MLNKYIYSKLKNIFFIFFLLARKGKTWKDKKTTSSFWPLKIED